jgi:hypothetical protein
MATVYRAQREPDMAAITSRDRKTSAVGGELKNRRPLIATKDVRYREGTPLMKNVKKRSCRLPLVVPQQPAEALMNEYISRPETFDRIGRSGKQWRQITRCQMRPLGMIVSDELADEVPQVLAGPATLGRFLLPADRFRLPVTGYRQPRSEAKFFSPAEINAT